MAKRSGTAARSRRKKTASAQRAMAVGRRLAGEVLRFRDQALRRRAAAVRHAAPMADARAVSPRLIRAAGVVLAVSAHRRARR